MSSVTLASIAFAFIVLGMTIGLVLRRILPEQHLRDASRDTVKTGAGLIATLAALVLGLLVTSAKSVYDSMNAELTLLSTKIILLDKALARYGPDTLPMRQTLKQALESGMHKIWPDEFVGRADYTVADAQAAEDRIEDSVRSLPAQNEAQKASRDEALKLIGEVSQLRWLLFEQSHTGLPTAFIVLLIFWLSVLFGTFGLLAPPRNKTVVVVLLLCAISICSVIFLIREMNHPLRGAVQVSSAPARQALNQLGR